MTDASFLDGRGRPRVVVTGMGVITSLGAGREDNWQKLTAGESGIREITRISTEGLKTRIAGTVDFIPVEHPSSPALSERLAQMAAEEAIAQSSIGSGGDFPGPLFIAVAPLEIEWAQREELVRASGANDGLSYPDLWRAGETSDFYGLYERFLFGSVAANIAEGMARKHRRERANFLRTSWASLAELSYCLHAAKRLEYITENEHDAVRTELRAVAAPLFGLLKNEDPDS
jgi:3-oxoacyl-[acyl-carrier-protein] synthase II